MTNQLSYSFHTVECSESKTYFLEGQEYLLARILNNNFILFNHPFPLLLVPNDSSILAASIRDNPRDFFQTPFSNLKFQPELWKNDNEVQSAFLVKDTNQVQKITKPEIHSPQTLTFKVWSQKKTRREGEDPRIYKHWLEIEPFSLGLEGLPEISKIMFSFGYGQSLENSPESLIKTSLYKHPILTESTGKTFTIRVKSLMVVGEKENGEGNDNVLLFNSWKEFEIDKFLQENTLKNEPMNNKGGLLIFVIGLIIVVFLGVIIWLGIKKNRVKNK